MKIHEFIQTLVLISVNHGNILAHPYPENGAFFCPEWVQKYPSLLLGIFGSKNIHCIICIIILSFLVLYLYILYISLHPKDSFVAKLEFKNATRRIPVK